MSAVRIPADRWPWRRHRTMAEVARTEELTARADAGLRFSRAETGEFGNLLIKARKHNPPPEPKPGAAA